jgi:hypothetical protein
MQDQLLELDAQAAEDASAVEKVRTTLLEWDEALRKACEDLARARTVAAEWETEVATRLVPSSSKTARPPRERVLGRARPRRRP